MELLETSLQEKRESALRYYRLMLNEYLPFIAQELNFEYLLENGKAGYAIKILGLCFSVMKHALLSQSPPSLCEALSMLILRDEGAGLELRVCLLSALNNHLDSIDQSPNF